MYRSHCIILYIIINCVIKDLKNITIILCLLASVHMQLKYDCAKGRAPMLHFSTVTLMHPQY